MTQPAFLAYVFWHWMRPGPDAGDYEGALRRFQDTLADHPPPGFRGAAVFRCAPVPWLPEAGRPYVDWYVIDGSAAMDPLNDAAIAAACRTAHDAAAERAAGGTAGLYGLRSGCADARSVTHATWFSKPAGMSYEDLDAAVARGRGSGPSMLWSRRMTLGPGPEFCCLGGGPAAFPDPFAAVDVPMTLVWSAEPRDTTKPEVPLS